MGEALTTVLTASLEAIAPPTCAACGGDVETWAQVACRPCHDTFEPMVGPHCSVCGTPFAADTPFGPPRPCGRCAGQPPSFERARAFGAYGGALEELVAAFKFRGRRDLAKPLAALMALTLDDGFEGIDLVAPVPLSRRRLRERGYDQAWLLARALGGLLHIPSAPRALRRTRHTAPQTTLSATGRRHNVHGAFEMGPDGVVAADILLVDDVFTTGATAGECARILMRSGASRVRVVTVARAS